MGLAVCHGIVKRHGGTMSLDSTLGKGTTVTLRLPAIAVTAETAETAITQVAA
jgi:signal transduction histidine kinase